MHPLKVFFVLTAAAAASSCGGGGGGGGGDAASVAPPDAATQAPARGPAAAGNGSLQADVAAATYAEARRLNAFNQLNAVRLGSGAGLLAQSDALDTSASRHAAYLALNGYSGADSPHDEVAAGTAFYGVDPFVRMQAAGYDYSYATEVIGDIGSSSATSDCVGDLLDTVYHAAAMLSRVTDVGFGFGSGTTAGMCTIDMASPLNGSARQIPPSGAIVAYPFDGGTVAHGTFRVSNETPRVPVALLPGATAGTPVVVGFRNQDVVAGGQVAVAQFSIATAAGAALPAIVLGGQGVAGPNVQFDAQLDDDFAVLVPVAPLDPGTYTVTLRATVSGGEALALTHWSFTVGAK